jgi:predicted permease
MKTLRTYWSRICSLWQRAKVKREIDEELRFHLEQRTAENLAAGMSPEDAAREARKRFGNLQSVREECRDARGVSFGETLAQDIRFGLRMLRKNPGFTTLAALTLGLGIGAASTLFGVFDSLVLDPFPYPRAERIACLWSGEGGPLSAPDFRDIHEQNNSFSHLGVYTLRRFNLGLDTPAPAYGALCTAGVLQTLGMRPALGRWIEEADEQPGAPPVTVISHTLWSRVFAADHAAVGRTVRLDGREVAVVGVMPPEFEFNSPRYEGHDCELWLAFSPMQHDSNRGDHWLMGIGRLKDGVSLEAADAEIKTIGVRLAKEYPSTNLRKRFLVRSLWRQTTENTASGALLLFGAATFLLLVACANVASLLLARGTRRQGEFGVRLALGGARRDIIRLVLCESLLLALLGSGVGIVLAGWGLALMKHVIPQVLVIGARREALELNGPVLAFSIAVAGITAALFGLLPALAAARTPAVETLNSDGRSQTGSRLRHRFLRHLVAGQVALALVLGNIAGLLFCSYLNVLKANRALVTDQVVTAELTLKGGRYRESEARRSFWRDLFGRVRALPGVEAVAITTQVPLEGGNNTDILVDDEIYDPTIERTAADQTYISPEYFAAMRIPILQGRAPEPEDGRKEALGVAVNQTLANKYWPGQDPIGRRIRGNSQRPWFEATVVGVVGDVRQWGAEEPAHAEIFFAHASRDQSDVTLVVRASGNAHPLVSSLRDTVASLDRDLPLANVRTMTEVVSKATSPRRFLTQMIGLFMGATLILAMVGVYGTLSYIVSQRQREIGIRMALGAMRRDILAFVLRLGAHWVLAGLVLGLVLTLSLSFLLRSAVYGVNALDPLLLFSGIVVVGGAAALACLLPARRAAKVEPMQALRCE